MKDGLIVTAIAAFSLLWCFIVALWLAVLPAIGLLWCLGVIH